MIQTNDLSKRDFLRVTFTLLRAELVSGIFGLKLFIACVTIASFMMSVVWLLGDGLSQTLTKSGNMFLGGDVAITSVNLPLTDEKKEALSDLGTLSEVVELRTFAQLNDGRIAVELKAVDDLYPLYGQLELSDTPSRSNQNLPTVIVEEGLINKLGVNIGDQLTIADGQFIISNILLREPDRLSAGRFMVGPRVMMSLSNLETHITLQRGALAEYRYRIKENPEITNTLLDDVTRLKEDASWEIETPSDAGDRVLRTVNRATTFLGMAGIAAFLIGLSGAWSAAQTWVRRRSRTIALYRLSGASAEMVLTLHGVIIFVASFISILIGLALSLFVAYPLLEFMTQRLHVPFLPSELWVQFLKVILMITIGLTGTAVLALSGVYDIAPSQAMRSGDTPLKINPRHASFGILLVFSALFVATLSLPFFGLAMLALLGLIFAISMLALSARWLSKKAARQTSNNFIFNILFQTLSHAGQTAGRTVAIGIGIIGITTIYVAQSGLENALDQELPQRVPDLVLIDAQPNQVDALKERIEQSPDFSALQYDPFMRMSITAVNGIPAKEALVLEEKSWVIEGDRSFSWTAEPTGAELLAGEWWSPDYNGPALISPEEDVMEAFDLKVGDTISYSFLGRSFTSEVVNIRKEYHRTFRPEYLMVASPEPFRNAPHSWIMSFKGESPLAINNMIRELARDYPNVTTIDIRPIITQVSAVVYGTINATLIIAGLLSLAGALSLTALVVSDVDARKKEALVFTLVGASIKEIATVRFLEAVTIGMIAAILGGAFGILGGYFITIQAIQVDWQFEFSFILLPFILGILSTMAAGLFASLNTTPKGKGQMIRHLAT